MKEIKTIFGIGLLILVGFISYGLFSMPRVEKEDSRHFSAERCVKDIEVLSYQHRSIDHPFTRTKIRKYLQSRLDSLGGKTEIYPYDSIESKFGGYFDIANVYGEFPPSDPSIKEPSWVLLVAHLDSRFKTNVLGKMEYSYGAADDGYGLAVALELIHQALPYRDKWEQGIKVLFTDAEEHSLDGARRALNDNPELFEGVNLVINLEARGVKGPALLFETSGNNSELMNLYKKAKYPYSYSLATVVYSFLPNFTDFTVLKKDIPGYNFSVVDNLHYYHTAKDNFDNINPRSIQHYGAQLEPMMYEYLTNKNYSSVKAFKAKDSKVHFTLPLLGLFSFSKMTYNIICIIVYILFLFVLIQSTRRIRIGDVFKKMFTILLMGLLILGIGEGVAWIAAKITGTKFDLVATKYIYSDWIIMIVSAIVLTISYISYYNSRNRKGKKSHLRSLMGTLMLLMIFSIAMQIAFGENFLFLVPLALALIALIYINWLTSLLAILLIALLGFSFFYILYVVLSIGALGVVLMFMFFYIIIIVSLFDCYLNPAKWRHDCFY